MCELIMSLVFLGGAIERLGIGLQTPVCQLQHSALR
jgi:hypothetical protein